MVRVQLHERVFSAVLGGNFTHGFSLQGPLMNWLKVNFSQAFSAWIHLKAVRVFTESVLRYES